MSASNRRATVRVVLEDPADFGARIDRVLARELARAGHEVTRSQLARSFEDRAVRVGDKAIKPSFRLDAPLCVDVALPQAPPLARAFPEDLPLTVMYEDEALLVVDKPARMVVHAGAGHDRGTLVNAVLFHLQLQAPDLPVMAGNGPERPGVVHRLDKDTSGAMVFAKTRGAQASLGEQFRQHSIDRQYLAICRGALTFDEKRIETQHGRDAHDRRRYGPSGPRRAISRFYRLRATENASLMICRLQTGRTHQIRMHARYIGHPLLADPLYGHRSRDAELARVETALGRHALHAQTLGFEHPYSGKRLSFESPVSADLRTAMLELGLSMDLGES